MPDRQLHSLISHLRQRLRSEDPGGLGDAQVLERWLTRRDETAFEVLVWRHGPMVLSVCQRLLHHPQDVEDAFQATFLTLIRKAPAIRRREGVAGWLYRVAYRVSVRASISARRREQREQPLVKVASRDADSDFAWRELRPVLDEEINKLPARCRNPFVLCYLQGRTNAQAAHELGCPEGTIASRLAWARKVLRERLLRRGIAPVCAGLTVLATRQVVTAEMPAALARATIKAGLCFVGGKPINGLVSSSTISLTEGVLRTMSLKPFKLVTTIIVLFALLGGSLTYALLAEGIPADEASNIQVPVKRRPAPEQRLARIACQQEGLVLFIGTPAKADAKGPVQTVKVGDATVTYRSLHVGDTVESGQLLGQLDSSLARVDVEIQKAKIKIAGADLDAAEKTRDEAQHRYFTQLNLWNNGQKGGTSQDEVRGAKLTWDRYIAEAISKREELKTAQLELKRAEIVLSSYDIRCRVHGVIKEILKQPGEAVHKLEPVIVVELTKE